MVKAQRLSTGGGMSQDLNQWSTCTGIYHVPVQLVCTGIFSVHLNKAPKRARLEEHFVCPIGSISPVKYFLGEIVV